MNTTQNTNQASTIEQQLSSVRMSQSERNAVSHAYRIAEAIVNAISWVCHKAAMPDAGVTAKPSLKY